MKRADEEAERPLGAGVAEHRPPLTVTVQQAVGLTGLSRSLLWKLISEGTLASVSVGRRRLVNYQSLKQLVDKRAA